MKKPDRLQSVLRLEESSKKGIIQCPERRHRCGHRRGGETLGPCGRGAWSRAGQACGPDRRCPWPEQQRACGRRGGEWAYENVIRGDKNKGLKFWREGESGFPEGKKDFGFWVLPGKERGGEVDFGAPKLCAVLGASVSSVVGSVEFYMSLSSILVDLGIYYYYYFIYYFKCW